ncbi:hypothetical protein TNCV_2918361 [Trichonephila clavipes]|nr:hypothetical protein TNCV_2918361 [Trichonephila clavipes]
MGHLTYAEKADRHYMYGSANGNGRAALRMNHAQFSDGRMLEHRIFQRFHRQLRETRSIPITRRDYSRRRAVSSPSLEKKHLGRCS